MTHSVIDWEVSVQSDLAFDPEIVAPAVLPIFKPQATRRVGVIKSYSPRKSYGLVETADEHDAIFNIDDVAPSDRGRLGSGQTVTFQAVTGPDGLAAKEIRIDATTLPPMPDAAMLAKGWR
jgi:cold shock CspA family protein